MLWNRSDIKHRLSHVICLQYVHLAEMLLILLSWISVIGCYYYDLLEFMNLYII